MSHESRGYEQSYNLKFNGTSVINEFDFLESINL